MGERPEKVEKKRKRAKKKPLRSGLLTVRMKGLEPPRLAAPDPKSGAAANYATSAKLGAQIYVFYLIWANKSLKDLIFLVMASKNKYFCQPKTGTAPIAQPVRASDS